MYNPDADVVVLFDKKTKKGLTGKRAEYEKYISEIKVIAIPDEYNQKEASRWIKTSIRKYITEDFLFIDCDTVITEKLAPEFPFEIKIGAVLDTHVNLSNHHLKDYFQRSDSQIGFDASFKQENHYNGGLIFCRDCVEGDLFFEKWHELWLKGREKGNVQDMPSLNQADHELNGIITELGGEWNCQISHNGLPFLYNAKIIHYYATSLISFTPPYLPASENTLSSIRENGVITPEIIKLLEHPKTAFEQYTRIVADRGVIDAFDSSLFSKIIWLRKKHPILFQKLNTFMYHLTKSVKRLFRK
ncbi:glycosyltransferase [Treponema primitia]|nr:glycosyltransferase [Treponema primitia]